MVKTFFGVILIVIPFVTLAFIIGKKEGWKVVFQAYGLTAAIAIPIILGAMLLGK